MVNDAIKFKDSIALRYFIAIVSVLIIGQLIFSTFILYTNFNQQRADLYARAISHVHFLSEVMPDNILTNNFYPLETLMQQTAEEEDFVYSVAIHVDGRLITNYLNGADPLVQQAVAEADSLSTLNRIDYISSLPNIIEVGSPIIADDVLIGNVRLGYSMSNLAIRLQSSIATTLLWSAVFSLILAFVTIALFNLQIRNPLRNLGMLATRLASGNLDTRAVADGKTEISQLQKAFNNMAAQIQENIVEMNKLSQVASRTKNAVIIADPMGRIEWVNQAFVDITGYTLSEVQGKTPGAVLQGKKSDPKTISYMREHLQRGEGFNAEIINYHKSGEVYWVAIEVRPVFDDEQTLINYIAIEIDITEHKKATERIQHYTDDLKKQEERLRSLMVVATQSTDTQTQLNEIVQQGSKALDMLSGIIMLVTDEHHDMIAVHQADSGFSVDVTSADVKYLIDETLQLRDFLAYPNLDERRAYPTDRIESEIQAYMGMPVWVDNQIVGILGFFSSKIHKPFTGSDFDFLQLMVRWVNITLEIQKSRDELAAYAKELERSNRELQDFAYASSHDLQEPLRKIQAFGSRIESRYGDILDEHGRDYLQRMRNAANRMQSLINDLLEFSRVTTQAKEFREVNLNKTLAGVLSDLEVRINETQATINYETLPTIDAEPLHMRQLLQNIISNAIKFHHPDRLPVVIMTSQIIKDDIRRQILEIRFSDNGIGFDQKYADKIFTVFQRLHGRNEYEGTGIGLAICSRIVEYHNGVIDVTSVEGEGTVFTIRLPVQQSRKQTSQ